MRFNRLQVSFSDFLWLPGPLALLSMSALAGYVRNIVVHGAALYLSSLIVLSGSFILLSLCPSGLFNSKLCLVSFLLKVSVALRAVLGAECAFLLLH